MDVADHLAMMKQLTALLLMVFGAFGFSQTADANSRDMSAGHACLSAAMQWERKMQTPDGLVRAIALAESARWDPLDARSIPWPWTVNNGGAGTHYATKEAAIQAVLDLQAQGETNIDVGCMQINLRWHGENFQSLHQAFDPNYNMKVAAGILSNQYRAHRDWGTASGNYHSATPHLHTRYRKKVDALLASLDQRAPLDQDPNLMAALNKQDPRSMIRQSGRASRPHWSLKGGSMRSRMAAQATGVISPQTLAASRFAPKTQMAPTGHGPAYRGMGLAAYRAMAKPRATRTTGLNLVTKNHQ